MNEITLVEELVENVRRNLGSARESIAYAARDLYFIREQLPEGTKFGQYVEENIGISGSTASKWVGNYEAWVIQGGVDIEAIAGIDQDKLLLAKSLSGSIEERLSKAKVLNRAELRAEKVDDGHVHSGETVEIHKCCGMRVAS